VSIAFSPMAVYDIDDAAETLELGRQGSGARFRADLQKVLARLERLPESGAEYEPPSPNYPGLRQMQLIKFWRYTVYYQPTADGIFVVRCLHGSRNVSAIFGSP
jgi:plasmid stabilization system protein ParE